MELAGGLRLVGGGDSPSGVFGMEFSQPPYQWETGAFQANINFAFKKSVFFAEFLIICLGSGITSSNSSPNITQVCVYGAHSVVTPCTHKSVGDLKPKKIEPSNLTLFLVFVHKNCTYINGPTLFFHNPTSLKFNACLFKVQIDHLLLKR